MSQFLLSAMQGRRVFRIGLLASTIAAFLPTHVNSYASSPSTTSGESICFSSSKLIARLIPPCPSDASVTQFGNRAAIFSMFSDVKSGVSNFGLRMVFILSQATLYEFLQTLFPLSLHSNNTVSTANLLAIVRRLHYEH